jgi:quercetin dioxygenase-like cupin family protein
VQKLSLVAAARQALEQARSAPTGRSASTLYGGHEHALRQTVIALRAGSALHEHENPGEATVQVLTGRVQLSTDSTVWDGRQGDLLIVPDQRHRLNAVEDSTILLTAVPRAHTR